MTGCRHLNQLRACYGLLGQRPARRSARLDPDDARVCPPEVVERYHR